MARLALEKHTGDIMHAAEELISNDGIVSGDLSMLKSKLWFNGFYIFSVIDFYNIFSGVPKCGEN